jgi:hypothetical protein
MKRALTTREAATYCGYASPAGLLSARRRSRGLSAGVEGPPEPVHGERSVTWASFKQARHAFHKPPGVRSPPVSDGEDPAVVKPRSLLLDECTPVLAKNVRELWGQRVLTRRSGRASAHPDSRKGGYFTRSETG